MCTSVARSRRAAARSRVAAPAIAAVVAVATVLALGLPQAALADPAPSPSLGPAPSPSPSLAPAPSPSPSLAPAPGVPAADRVAIDAARAARLAGLRSESGWLTLVGLAWLKPGANTLGRGSTNTAVVPYPKLPERIGTFVLRDGRVRFTAARGVAVAHDGARVKRLDLVSDRAGAPTILEYGSLRLHVIERAGRHLVRIRDLESPRLREFAGLAWFPIADGWVFDARFEPYVPERTLGIMNVLGYEEPYRLPGRLVFTKDGREWALDALIPPGGDGSELFLMFADGTTGRETYGAGRYLYVDAPRDGHVRVDFNLAINAPCAFNEFATCPLPPRQNRLPLRIEAGEQTYAGAH
jgi:uncharacterized protein (DUF1684 family)